MVDRKLELAFAGDLETSRRLEHAVTVSFLHEKRVRLRDSAEAADGPPPVRAAQKSASGGEPGGHEPGVEVIASTASKVNDPVVAPVFATPEATWTVAAQARTPIAQMT